MSIGPKSADQKIEEFRRLGDLQLLPPACEVSTYAGAKSSSKGLLAVWKEWLRQAPSNRRSRAARIHSGLLAAVENGAELTFEIPGRDRLSCERWLGQRAYWWPSGIPEARSVGIVASRLSRDSGKLRPVINALRLSMDAIDPSAEQLLASRGTALFDYVESCATSFDVGVLKIFADTVRQSASPWLDDLIQPQSLNDRHSLLLSPVVDRCLTERAIDEKREPALLDEVPIRDRILALLSRRLFVLSLRRNGNWWKILQVGFSDGLWEPAAVRIVAGESLCAPDVASEFQNCGAVHWYLSSEVLEDSVQQVTSPSKAVGEERRTSAEDALVSELLRADSETEWLIHWTRAPRGEWVGESREEYLEDIVQHGTAEARSAYGTLERIVNEQLIRTTPGNTRTGREVVCLSQAGLAEALSRRIFRKHRGRWDYEHYGVGIRTSVVRSMGGRPVIYGDEETWQSLPEGERSWFQRRKSERQSSSETIDWTIENEWRLATNLELGGVRAEDLFIFCATEEEASNLRTKCDWRIVSVEQLQLAIRGTGEEGN